MSDLYLATTNPQTNDSEKLLLARIGALAGLTSRLPGVNGIALASAARTVTTVSGVIQVPAWARNLLVHLNVTAASGTGGLKMVVRNGLESAMAYGADHAATAFIISTGARIGYFGPAAQNAPLAVTSGFTYVHNCPLSPWITIGCQAGDASSYTYEMRYAFMP